MAKSTRMQRWRQTGCADIMPTSACQLVLISSKQKGYSWDSWDPPQPHRCLFWFVFLWQVAGCKPHIFWHFFGGKVIRSHELLLLEGNVMSGQHFELIRVMVVAASQPNRKCQSCCGGGGEGWWSELKDGKLLKIWMLKISIWVRLVLVFHLLACGNK